MLKAYKYRIYPNKQQKELLAKHFGSCRFIYNHFLEMRIKHYKDKGKRLNYLETQNMLPALKKDKVWLKEIGSQSLQTELRYLDNAYKKFFKEKKGFPKFKNRRSRQSFTIPNTNNIKVDFDKKITKIPKFDWIKTVFHRSFEGKIKQATVSKTTTDKYYISITVEGKETEPDKKSIQGNTSVGIDLGIKDFAILSTTEKIQNPKYLKKTERRIRKLNKSLARKQKKSKSWDKTRKRLAKSYERLQNQRLDFSHKLSSAITKRFDTVIIEDLAIKNLIRNKKLSTQISDVSWGEFVRQLDYKTAWTGKNLIKIDRWFPSSKTCSHCGYVKDDLRLSDRQWICPECNAKLDRDINASINIKKQGLLSELYGTGQPEQYKSTQMEYAMAGSQFETSYHTMKSEAFALRQG